ncbi:MAG: alpha-amylase/4-alpha-glucanotransferase domain-containing protein [Sulfuricurvum sp.]
MKTKLLFGIHCHQPVENFYHIVDEAIEKSYKPFITLAKKFPAFKFAVHFSGWLLEYIEKNDPELFTFLQEMSASKQIEFFTGGFYEPILPSIPSPDRIAQITKLSIYIKKHFAQTPKGIWLTERVWDDSIIADLSACNLCYAIIDDYHLLRAGVEETKTAGMYVTDDSQYSLTLFPINKNLRYAIPFQKVDIALNEIKKITGENRASILFDDGEKFGLWPKTYEWVFEKKWLEEFLEKIVTDKTIESMTFAEFYATSKPIGTVYLPNVSYFEMSKWSLSPSNFEAFEEGEEALRESPSKLYYAGGTWKNFFIKYPESNYLHKRVLDLSQKRASLKNKKFDDAIFKAQANDVFWHGIFGGLYLPNLRDNAYRFVIEAENLLPQEANILSLTHIKKDGYQEAKFKTNSLIAVFDEKNGGQLRELSVRDALFNYQNTLSRKLELYHKNLFNTKESDTNNNDAIATIHDEASLQGESQNIYLDWYPKNSFVDHITDDTFNTQSFRSCSFREYGDFANQPFKLTQKKEGVLFEREGGIFIDETFKTLLTKRFKINENRVEFSLNLQTDAPKRLSYVCEFNFHFQEYGKVVLKHTEKMFYLEDKNLGKTLSFMCDSAFEFFVYELKTISKSEKGFDETVQCLSIGLKFPFKQALSINGTLEVL